MARDFLLVWFTLTPEKINPGFIARDFLLAWFPLRCLSYDARSGLCFDCLPAFLALFPGEPLVRQLYRTICLYGKAILAFPSVIFKLIVSNILQRVTAVYTGAVLYPQQIILPV